MNLIEKAKQFAHEAHDSIGQKRKYSGEPYWVHTDAVADKVAAVGGSETMIAAAHLHDVLEDVTPLDKTGRFNYATIVKEFGEDVARLVRQLTDMFTKEAFPTFNRKERKAMERERVKNITPEAKTIELADLINNTQSIVADDKDFAKVYLREKLLLLPILSEGNSELLNIASIQATTACMLVGVDIITLNA